MKMLFSVSAIALASMMGAGAALAADLPETVIVPAPDMVDVSSDWSGFYLGGNIGYAAGTVSWETIPFFFGDEYDIEGWTAGGQVGFNHQMDNLVVGAEASLSWSGVSGDDLGGFIGRDINWSGDVTGKLGFAVESILLYAKAGLAFANSTGFVGPDEETQTHLGWTAGLGITAKVTDDVSIFAEYNYNDYGSQSYYGDDFDVGFTTQAVKFGANWHF
ncbi:MAG: porin family protein [Alphaproteobacteria bacterium]|nr:MAG: porin family protein [Alphaproteobacteria bacterium]